MRLSVVRPLTLMVTACIASGSLCSQIVIKRLSSSSTIEPGLEVAVDWKWRVVATDETGWGMELPEALKPKVAGSDAFDQASHPAIRPETYEVKKGDALIKIARRFDMTVGQLKQFNDLKGDLIRIGQVLRIPSPGEVLMMIPPPPVKPEKDIRKPVEGRDSEWDFISEEQEELENVRLQVFLDREMFSPGMINGKAGKLTKEISEVYQRAHSDAATPGLLKVKAEAMVKKPYTRYVLRAEDFKFIKFPKEDALVTRGTPSAPKRNNRKGSKKTKSGTVTPPPVTTFDLIEEDFLGYTSAWEFVAERFHCAEEFLHRINPKMKGMPVVGSEFQVPNVIPFEIENAVGLPLQPEVDSLMPVTVAVVLQSRLEISIDGELIAAMPLTMARPGLHGRKQWTVLSATSRPHLVSSREPREAPKNERTTTADGDPATEIPIVGPPVKEFRLACGPNNPVGIIWIDLAKSGSTDPLPYGLHGTSIPEKMGTRQGIGGLRLTNWDIARAARLIPAGTALQWKAR